VEAITAHPGQITVGLTLSPDRRWNLHATRDAGGSDLMLVENFR